MAEILGDYRGFVTQAEALLYEKGIIPSSEVVQCDMLNYECDTNERYDEVKDALLRSAKILSEIEHGGRLVSIFQLDSALQAGNWRIPYVELLQPKPTRQNIDGIDSVFFVTEHALPDFLARHGDIFEPKGLANEANPYVELKKNGVAVKLHDRHMGAALEIERKAQRAAAEAHPIVGGHVTI